MANTATVPAICVLKAEIEGTTRLIQHRRELLANPISSLSKAIKKLTSKGSKKMTDDDWYEVFRLEFSGGIYMRTSGNGSKTPEVFLPGANIRKMLIEAARVRRLGKQFERMVSAQSVPLKFPDQGLSTDELWEQEDYRHIVPVCVGSRSTVMRSRPKFEVWGANLEIIYDASQIDEDVVLSALKYGGQYIGLCERSLGDGRFAVLSAKSEVVALG